MITNMAGRALLGGVAALTLGMGGYAATAQAGTSTSTSTSTSSATTRVHRCATHQLSLTVDADAYADGLSHYAVAVVLTNVSHSTCTVYGYPGVELQDAHQKRVADARRGQDYLFPDPGKRLVTLRPGASASAGLGVTTSGRRPAVAQLAVTPPDERASLGVQVDLPNPVRGSVHVSALVPGKRGPHQH